MNERTPAVRSFPLEPGPESKSLGRYKGGAVLLSRVTPLSGLPRIKRPGTVSVRRLQPGRTEVRRPERTPYAAKSSYQIFLRSACFLQALEGLRASRNGRREA